MKNKKIKKIPEYITYFRLALVPLILLFGITKHYKVVFVLIILAFISDFLDGYLAHKWLVESKKENALDVLINKVFFISVILVFAFKIHFLIIPLILEIAIGGLNFYYFNKNGKVETLMIGKIKSVIQALLIICSLTFIFKLIPYKVLNGFIIANINIQILTIIYYYLHYKDNKKEKNEIKTREQRKQLEDLEEKTLYLDKIQDLLKDYENNDVL